MQNFEQGGSDIELNRVNEREQLFEFMLNASRLTAGFELSLFTERTGLSSELLLERMASAHEKRLIEEVSGGTWRATSLGMRFLNDLQAEFLP